MALTSENDVNQDDHLQARFQRTDQWKPVYTWLETLEDTEVVKSNDIGDWLSANPNVRDDLYSRQSCYHLMHYIKKLHVKILKRKERKKGLPITKANKKIMSKSEGK
ncbi:RING finger protein [Heracleum sosnowskyi]|uniref:RING finger protein n=1 Tax=Heracleum sosnowskyi TaxID=360622 RepID=A0AAD8I842_9APIA|nr:RING finger protein [Heracleum sosnowskyi]